jgi:mono/diheme cytochrome c family protein
MKMPSTKVLVAVIVGAVVLLVGAGAIGWAIGDSGSSSSESSAPAGHTGGANLAVGEIGDPEAGRALFVSKNCSNCHSYLGKGGEDAPALDFMRGHLSATEIANMSGRIWNHLPFMISAFKEEGISLPTFDGNEMADLTAYLHSGVGGAPEVTEEEGGGMHMGEGTETGGGMTMTTGG